jgi:hypothetical protein
MPSNLTLTSLRAPVRPGVVSVFNVKDFGARGDGITDDTASFVAALATGGKVYAPDGTYLVNTDALSLLVAGQQLIGAGRTKTKIVTTGTGTLLTVAADNVVVQDLSFQRLGGPGVGAGAGIVLQSGVYATLSRLDISHFYRCMWAVNAYAWTLENVYFVSPTQYGLLIQNVASPDSGNQNIRGCTFDTSQPTAAAIRHESGGGLRVIGNKFLRCERHYDLQVADGASTSIIILEGNSFEVASVESIRLGRGGTSGQLAVVAIDGNTFNCGAGAPSQPLACDGISMHAGVSEVSITGNQWRGDAAKTAVRNVTGNAPRRVITGNQFVNFGIGIANEDTVSQVEIGPNSFHNVPVPVEDNAASGQVALPIHHHYRRAIENITSSSTYTNYWRVDCGTNRGFQVEVVVQGLATGLGVFGRTITKMVTRNAAVACTVTAVADVTSGATVDVQFDNSTTTGSVIVGVKINGAASALNGTISLRLDGHVLRVNRL